MNFGSILTGDIVEKLKVILHLHLRAVSRANRQTSEVKLSGIPSAFEEPVKKRNVKRVVKICTLKVWDLQAVGHVEEVECSLFRERL